ncbi:DUF1700 domain-containing protein [Streptococcus oriscaviae]|uniref:DUF1700 domain-containing protein n=1 Tax=Streptococcus oriscaviae TaxID=2781599 RepID=A0ABX7YLJ1_9STRE|nr:DUF1700 domain-containing protein [Streptococcus oriscaviae]QUE54507.1 DUF1700 domain-containing protein [Streptococcus oriscaviae]
MKREEFIEALKLALKDLPEQEIQSSLAYFNEMIDDRIDEGMTEEEAVADMGPVNDIATKLLMENQTLVNRVKDKIIPKRRLATWEIILLILGFPIWGSLLLAVAAILISVVVVVVSVGLGAIASIFAGIVMLFMAPFNPNSSLDGRLFSVAISCLSVGLGLIFFSWLVQLFRFIKSRVKQYRK